MKQIYLDNAATTAVDSQVFKAMKPYFLQKYGNASEFHALGQEARLGIEEARLKVAAFLGANPSEIIFTGSATESINLSHKGLIEGLILKLGNAFKPHIITSAVEHKAVLETCKHLENSGLVDVTYLPVDHFGQINIKDLEESIRPETVLVSIMYVNNEVSTIQPIAEIGSFIKKVNEQRTKNNEQSIFFHTDATQAIQYLDCNIDRLGVDLLSFTGHKIYAPKGIGALYIRKGTPIKRQMDGGAQEGRLRAGTENVPYIVGLGRAIDLISKTKTEKTEKLQEKLIAGVLKISGVEFTGHPKNRVPHIASFIVSGVEGESIVLLLSDKKITASTGSACNASDLQASHVLSAMGYSPEKSHGSLRLSLGKDTIEEDINYVIKVLPKIIADLRRMAPKF